MILLSLFLWKVRQGGIGKTGIGAVWNSWPG